MIHVINFTIKLPISLMSINMLNLFTPPPNISIPICQGHDAPNAKATKSKCSD